MARFLAFLPSRWAIRVPHRLRSVSGPKRPIRYLAKAFSFGVLLAGEILNCFIEAVDSLVQTGNSISRECSKRLGSPGAYLGLTPRRRQSGDTDQQLRISKTGNRRLRSLLVQCAQVPVGGDRVHIGVLSIRLVLQSFRRLLEPGKKHAVTGDSYGHT
jgi:hypothetical protein